MAILEMKKIALIAHQDSKNAILRSMQALSAVEVISARFEGLAAPASPERLAGLEARLSDVRFALETIRTYDNQKTSFLTPKPLISAAELASEPSRISETKDIIDKVKKLADDISVLKTRRQRLKNRIAQLAPYADFDVPLETLGESAYTVSLLGTIPDENKPKYKQLREEYADTAYFEHSPLGKDSFSVYVIMHKSVQERLTGELKFIGFSEAPAKESFGTTADILHDCKSEYDSLEHEAKEYEEIAARYAEHRSLLFVLEDYLLTEIARERCIEKLGETGSVFALEGWVIADERKRVEQAVLEAAPEAYVDFHDPADDEKPPTALANPRAVSPFEAVTNMYAVPSSRGLDPNKLVAVFYFIIFGMMMADFAYGLILSVGAFLMLRIKKPTGMFKKITTVILICGISTSLWGLFFGTIFSIEGVPYVLNPLADSESAMLTLMLCLGIGVLHIFTGLFVGMYMDIRRGKVFAAICDRFSWVLVIGGGIMLLIGGVMGTIGTYLALAGAAVLLLTQGRHKKGILKKMVGGLSSLYGVTGYVSDILSYSRIFGMGLATTVIAMVFNTIAEMLMGNVIGYIFGIVVLTVGHVFNLAINTLGSFVHTARLQYIEFFNRFYEGEGRTFMPLGLRTRHHRIGG